MGYYVELVLLACGIIIITLGYRRNKRNTMLAGAVLIYLSGTTGEPLPDYKRGLHDGYYGVNLPQSQAASKG